MGWLLMARAVLVIADVPQIDRCIKTSQLVANLVRQHGNEKKEARTAMRDLASAKGNTHATDQKF